jgi:hypothetical protein
MARHGVAKAIVEGKEIGCSSMLCGCGWQQWSGNMSGSGLTRSSDKGGGVMAWVRIIIQLWKAVGGGDGEHLEAEREKKGKRGLWLDEIKKWKGALKCGEKNNTLTVFQLRVTRCAWSVHWPISEPST